MEGCLNVLCDQLISTSNATKNCLFEALLSVYYCPSQQYQCVEGNQPHYNFLIFNILFFDLFLPFILFRCWDAK
jgi:hypothetical protein